MYLHKRLVPLLVALLLTGCTSRSQPIPQPAPAPSPPPAETPAPRLPTVVREGTSLRITGLSNPSRVQWAPGGQAALVLGTPGSYRLQLDPLDLKPLPDLGNFQTMGWAGPNEALLVRWGGAQTLGQLSLLTGEWQPLAQVKGQVAVCPSGENWVYVDITEIRQGGAGDRQIGAVYRTPTPKPGGAEPLGGKVVLERGALLGRLADGSCLLDGLDQRLLVIRPDGSVTTLTDSFALPQITRDGRGVVWLTESGDCGECVELGPGVPFRRLSWWRIDGKTLTADLGSPQVVSYLLSPDGNRLLIGHMDPKSKAGAISALSPEGFQAGTAQIPARLPAGWMGDDLMVEAAGPERWQPDHALYRAADGTLVAEWVADTADGGLLVKVGGELRYLAPQGAPGYATIQEGDGFRLIPKP